MPPLPTDDLDLIDFGLPFYAIEAVYAGGVSPATPPVFAYSQQISGPALVVRGPLGHIYVVLSGKTELIDRYHGIGMLKPPISGATCCWIQIGSTLYSW